MAHARRPLTHDENRHKVCIICFEKASYPITNTINQRIKDYFIENYDINEDCCPAAICGRCRAILIDISSGKKDPSILPEVYDFSNILPEYVISTRSVPNPICNCEMCQVARVTLSSNSSKAKKGRPCGDSSKSKTSNRVVKLCFDCKTPIGRGLSHKCNVSTLRRNLMDVCDSVDDRTRDIVAGKILTNKCEATSSNEVKLQTRGPSQLPIKIRTDGKTSQLTSSDMSSLQLAMGISNKQMRLTLIPFIRNVMGRAAVQTRTDIFLQNRDKMLEDFFEYTTMDFETGSKPIVYCNDVPTLIDYICRVRNLDPTHPDFKVKLGVDGGGAFMKFCLSIFSVDNDSKPRRRSKMESSFRNSSVKKIIIICIIPELQETHSNVRKVMELLNFTNLDIKFTFAMDFKLANIVAGIQAHGCTFPCLWCECPKKDFSTVRSKQYPLRTLGGVRSNAIEFRRSPKAEAKDFKNCVNEPLIHAPDNDIFLRHIPPPELHMLLRITNKIFKEMEKSHTGKMVAEEWIQKLGITRPAYHSNDFNGNMCKQILINVDVLYRIVVEKDAPELMSFIAAFNSFNAVRVACFGNDLSPDFEERIVTFQEKYESLNISVTSAVHVLFCHVRQFCKFFKAALGIFSEQASESVHRDFLILWQSSGKVDRLSAKYASNLYKTVIRYNGRHLGL